MIRSLAVILVPILVITAIATRNLDDHPVTVIDYAPVLAQARAEAPYAVLAPTQLPADWRAIRVSWVKQGAPGNKQAPSARNQWQLGYLAPNDIYIALVQGDRLVPELIEDETRGGLPDGSSQVNGATWERRVSADDRTRSLVSATDEVTTIVSGDTDYADLEAYAATLRSD